MKVRQYLKTNWGTCPLCNERPETAPHIGGFCFPICWRCLTLASTIIVAFVLLYTGVIPILLPIWAGILFLVPAVVDGVLQYAFAIPSTNARRIITGIIAGYGIANIILHWPNPFLG